MKIQLYDYYRSSACFRVRIALNLKNIPYTLIPIHLVQNGGEQHSQAYQEINPQQLVPTLSIDNEKNKKTETFTQSLAIIAYLDSQFPNPPLLPNDAEQKAQVNAFALAIAAEIHPLNNLRVLNYLTQDLKISDEQKQAWYEHWMKLGLSALEQMIVKQTQQEKQKKQTDFCFGNTPSLADICLVPQLYNARRFNCNLSSFPNLVRIDKNCQQLSPFQKAWPEEYERINL